MDLNSSYVMEARVLALQVDHVASPITPRDGLMIKPAKNERDLTDKQSSFSIVKSSCQQ